MVETNVVGKSVSKIDAKEKVLGTALYAADMKMAGMLYAKALRSKVAHGILRKINTAKAKTAPGVHAVLTGEDIPGPNTTGMILKDEPVIVGINGKIRSIGDTLAVVAAETAEIAEAALDLIEVEIEELPGIFCPFEAMNEDAPQLYAKGNILSVRKIVKGDIEKAFAECTAIVECQYKTSIQEHAYIEPEAGIARVEGDSIVIWCSTQNPHMDRYEVAQNLKLRLNQVRVIQATTGGGFGGKLDISVQIHLALLAQATKKPVKMVYSRQESMLCTGKRHPITMTFKTGCNSEGKLLAMESKIVADTGAYASYGPGVSTRAAVHATGPYEIPNVRIESFTVYTNNLRCGAFRGFGVPQVALAHESQLDCLAAKIGISPFDIRMKNALRPNLCTATGDMLTQSVGIAQTMEAARQKLTEESGKII
ncbi:MAG: xanthine dehydrogenase family protein molybdopterin-binding subunit [Peptococcaceae bacterium]